MKPPGSPRYHFCLITHAKLAKSNEAILRKWPKPLFWRHKVEYFGDIFLRNRAPSLFYIHQSLTSCKESEKSNGGKYENFWDGQTDGRTDGGGYIRTPEGVLINIILMRNSRLRCDLKALSTLFCLLCLTISLMDIKKGKIEEFCEKFHRILLFWLSCADWFHTSNRSADFELNIINLFNKLDQIICKYLKETSHMNSRVFPRKRAALSMPD